jgi:hypothetical protein
MTDNQIIDEIIVWAFNVHYPAPTPIGGWLGQNYGCDERRKWIIINKIEELGFARLYDRNSGSDMRLTPFGIRAAESGNPISFHSEQLAKKDKPNIQGNNIVYNSGSMTGSEINQGSNRRIDFFDAQANKNTPEQKPKQKSLMWDKVPDVAKILAAFGALFSLIKVVIEMIKK